MNMRLSILFWLIGLSALFYPTMAEETPEYEPLHILNIKYEYTMTNVGDSSSDVWRAAGPLYITLDTPEDVDRYIIFFDRQNRTDPHYFMGKALYQPVDGVITWPKVYYRTKFIIYGYVNGELRYKSEIISVDDYISEEDLNLIYKRTSAELIEDDKIGINIDNDTLTNYSEEQITLALYDFGGTKLLSKQLKPCETINLIDYRNRNLIVSYSFKGQSYIKKIYIP